MGLCFFLKIEVDPNCGNKSISQPKLAHILELIKPWVVQQDAKKVARARKFGLIGLA